MSNSTKKGKALYNFNFGNIARKADEYINAYTSLGYFSGSVLIASGNEILLSKGYGMANLEHGIPNTQHTKFRIASITKTFTASAIMQLYEKGLLDVNDRIDIYFPDYPCGDRITIHHLLTHTSGIVNFTDLSETVCILKNHTSIEQIIGIFRDKPLGFQPSMNYSYSNSGYVLLARIIEMVSGRPYEAYLKENIFDKLGMKKTGYDKQDEILKDRASGYTVSGDELVNAEFIDTSILYGWACLYSTVEDLYLWDRALYTESIASRQTLDRMATPFVSCGNNSSYGYGWFVNDKQLHHSGWLFGFTTNIARYTGKNTVIIILANNDLASVGNIMSGLEAIVFRKKYELPCERVKIEVDYEKYDSYIGTYGDGKIDVFSITRDDKHLFIEYQEVARRVRLELFPAQEEPLSSRYFTGMIDLQLTFEKNSKGRVKTVVLHRHGYKTKLKKHVG